MLQIIDNKSAIQKAQLQFKKGLKRLVDEKIPAQIGYQGENFKTKVSWSNKLRIWMHLSASGLRFWNAFGISESGKPRANSNISPICEINFPFSGIDRRIGGAFAEDGSGCIFVIHRGKIGGGRKGIGKTLFSNNYRGERINVKDGEIESRVALIGALNSPRFAKQVSQFVYEIRRIKALVLRHSKNINVGHGKHGFRKEFLGKKKFKIRKDIEAKCDHGIIVNELASVLNGIGLNVGNDINRDLYILSLKGKIAAIFEIKTDILSTNLYSGIGQLLLNSATLTKRPRLFLTIPERLNKTVERILNKGN